MRRRTYWKGWRGYRFLGAVLMTLALCLSGCKDDEDGGGAKAFDPNRPVTITSFTPESLGGGADMIIYGDNFGDDKSKVKVTLGGKDAKVIWLNEYGVYCLMPTGAFSGDIQVSILDDRGEVVAVAESEKKYTYEKQWLVTTAIGTYYEVGSDYEEKEGPIGDCGAFKGMIWFSWDPKSNFDHLYISCDYDPCRWIDFAYDNGPNQEPGYVYYMSQVTFDRVSVISWTNDENCDMILSENHANDNRIGNYLYTRASNFQNRQDIGINARGVNGTMVHPETGALYYTRYRGGDLMKYDFETGETTQEFVFAASPEAYRLVMHPTGRYAYIVGVERHFIQRTDYNEATGKFGAPYTVAGLVNSSGYNDGMGSFVRLNTPQQGVFVRNESYVGTRPDGDEYDFYFCDQNNHCVRILTPDGRVSTFAGRGDGKTSGYQDGEVRSEALFSSPRAIAYDEKRQCFYVGESGNWIIRKIALETEEDSDIVDEEAGEETNDSGSEESEGE